MNKNEYMEKIADLREKEAQLNKDYIESNKQYTPGTKVKVTGSNGKSRIGIVKDNIVSTINNEVVPMVMQLTNDGIESLRRIVIYPDDTIEVIND